ncbi:MAG: 50S ribosomal protein L22 [Verrucomicrobia bacterium]|jgi:large subunit ribosomal protein L22|nr:50S ribosomal protein L22 [Verrucomicrobiota bacterium]
MQVTSTYRFARISAFKAREVTREIQGRSASDALDVLAFSPNKAALLVKKTLKSAIANAENNAELKVDTLLVKEAVVGEGPTFKRFRARARGSASPLRKRTSHIRIVLSDELTPKAPIKRAKRRLASREGSTAQKPKADRDSVKETLDSPASRESASQKVTEPVQPPETVSETKPAEEKE